MLTLKQLRDDRATAQRRLAKKGVDAAPIIEKIEELDDKRKAIQTEMDNCLAEQNQAAKQIGALMGKGLRDEAEAICMPGSPPTATLAHTHTQTHPSTLYMIS